MTTRTEGLSPRSATTFGPYAGPSLGTYHSPVPFLLATGTWCRVSATRHLFSLKGQGHVIAKQSFLSR